MLHFYEPTLNQKIPNWISCYIFETLLNYENIPLNKKKTFLKIIIKIQIENHDTAPKKCWMKSFWKARSENKNKSKVAKSI